MDKEILGRDSKESILVVLLTTAQALHGMADRLEKMAELIDELAGLSQDYHWTCYAITA